MPEWLEIIPYIPVKPDLGTPFFAQFGPSCVGGLAGSDGKINWFTRSLPAEPGTERVDISQPNGFAWALRCLLSNVADEDEAMARAPSAWRTAYDLWQDYGVASGLTTDSDRLRLATALSEVFPDGS